MPKSKFLWLLLPGFIFLSLLAFLVSKAPQKTAVSTSSQLPNTTPSVSQNNNLSVPSQLQSLNDQIKSFRLTDPELAAPSFDRDLDIPSD